MRRASCGVTGIVTNLPSQDLDLQDPRLLSSATNDLHHLQPSSRSSYRPTMESPGGISVATHEVGHKYNNNVQKHVSKAVEKRVPKVNDSAKKRVTRANNKARRKSAPRKALKGKPV